MSKVSARSARVRNSEVGCFISICEGAMGSVSSLHNSALECDLKIDKSYLLVTRYRHSSNHETGPDSNAVMWTSVSYPGLLHDLVVIDILRSIILPNSIDL